jgi:hypothetical protein
MTILKTSIVATFLIALLSAVSAIASEASSFGVELSSAEVVRIADVLEHPERYVDKTIKVAGLVEDVCPMKGCWIDIVEQQSQSVLRFKVQDGVIVFPVTARGAEVVAEGVLRKHALSREQAIDWLRHLAEEKGEAFDAASVAGPIDIYQIEGAGARIEGR